MLPRETADFEAIERHIKNLNIAHELPLSTTEAVVAFFSDPTKRGPLAKYVIDIYHKKHDDFDPAVVLKDILHRRLARMWYVPGAHAQNVNPHKVKVPTKLLQWWKYLIQEVLGATNHLAPLRKWTGNEAARAAKEARGKKRKRKGEGETSKKRPA